MSSTKTQTEILLKNIKKLPILSMLLAVALLLLISACSQDGRDTEDSTTPVTVTYRLKWLLNASAAGDIWAEKAGFFKNAGLDVEIKEGGAEQDAITDILMKRATFGTASADQVIRAVSKGADIVVIAQIFQANPLQWIYFSEALPEITSPSMLKGLTIGITYGGNDEAIFNALMRKYRLNEDDVRLYAVHYDYAPFWKQEVNLWPVYRNTEGIILEEKMARQGHRAAFFDPVGFGINFVANSIVTSKHTWETEPELVRTFAKALCNAWDAVLSMENLHAAALALHETDSDTPVQTIMKQIESTRAFVMTDGKKTGRIDAEAWRQTARIMFEQKIVDRHVQVDSILIREIIP